jgi:hypothetical protein
MRVRDVFVKVSCLENYLHRMLSLGVYFKSLSIRLICHGIFYNFLSKVEIENVIYTLNSVVSF